MSQGYFPSGVGPALGDEVIPAPRQGEAIVFRDFFTAGLRFPCDRRLPSILDCYRVKLHQLTPNSFVALSKFY